MWKHSVGNLVSWLHKTTDDLVLVSMIETYFLAQDTKSMRDCLVVNTPRYNILARVHDKLGWDHFVEGRVASVYLETFATSLSSKHRRIENWGKEFVSRLMQCTHKQWLFRNTHVHYKKLDGLTAQQHENLFQRVKDLMLIDPADLLDKHRYLLEVDFGELGEGPTVNRQHWISSMESAITAAEYVRDGRPVVGDMGSFSPRSPVVTLRSSAQGSLVYRRSFRGRRSSEPRTTYTRLT